VAGVATILFAGNRPAAATSPSKPLAGKVVLVDPGHNGRNFTDPSEIDKLVPAGGFMKPCNTTGTAADNGYTEAAFNFDVGIRLAALLRAEGATVVMTRTNNTGVGPCVNIRAAIGNRAHADAGIAIHADGFASYGHGFQVIEPALIPGYTTPALVTASARLGQTLDDAMATSSGLTPSTYVGTDGIDVRSDLAGLNLAKFPMVFVECGNMKNPHDAALEESPRWREQLAHVLAAALTTFLRDPRSGG
jgi:N-acetylmuramoyl-L-alanine amidase